MKRVNHMLTERQIDLLHRLSRESGLSLSDLIRRALDATYGKAELERDQEETKDKTHDG
jgi:Ribbon-helix-helix protein, copG family